MCLLCFNFNDVKFCGSIFIALKLLLHFNFLQSGWVDVMLSHKELLQDVLDQISNLVQREEFTKSLVALGLVDPFQQGQSNQYAENAESRSVFPDQTFGTIYDRQEFKVIP